MCLCYFNFICLFNFDIILTNKTRRCLTIIKSCQLHSATNRHRHRVSSTARINSDDSMSYTDLSCGGTTSDVDRS